MGAFKSVMLVGAALALAIFAEACHGGANTADSANNATAGSGAAGLAVEGAPGSGATGTGAPANGGLASGAVPGPGGPSSNRAGPPLGSDSSPAAANSIGAANSAGPRQ
jgi:hypothetical protein